MYDTESLRDPLLSPDTIRTRLHQVNPAIAILDGVSVITYHISHGNIEFADMLMTKFSCVPTADEMATFPIFSDMLFNGVQNIPIDYIRSLGYTNLSIPGKQYIQRFEKSSITDPLANALIPFIEVGSVHIDDLQDMLIRNIDTPELIIFDPQVILTLVNDETLVSIVQGVLAGDKMLGSVHRIKITNPFYITFIYALFMKKGWVNEFVDLLTNKIIQIDEIIQCCPFNTEVYLLLSQRLPAGEPLEFVLRNIPSKAWLDKPLEVAITAYEKSLTINNLIYILSKHEGETTPFINKRIVALLKKQQWRGNPVVSGGNVRAKTVLSRYIPEDKYDELFGVDKTYNSITPENDFFNKEFIPALRLGSKFMIDKMDTDTSRYTNMFDDVGNVIKMFKVASTTNHNQKVLDNRVAILNKVCWAIPNNLVDQLVYEVIFENVLRAANYTILRFIIERFPNMTPSQATYPAEYLGWDKYEENYVGEYINNVREHMGLIRALGYVV